MLTPAWTPLRPHPTQCQLWNTKARFVAACAGRGSGKTELAKRKLVKEVLSPRKDVATPMYFYAGPTYNQAKRVAWNHLVSLFPPNLLAGEPSVGQLLIKTIYGSELHVVGMDKPQRIEGNQWCGGVIDESSDIKPGAYERSVRPALSHHEGWCWRIGVPKRFGVGAVDYRKFYEKGIRGEGGVESYTWPSWDILPEEEIKSMRESLDEQDFEEQAGGAWITVGGLCFHSFSYDSNVQAKVSYDPNKPIIVASDFNVSPMAWVLCQYDDVAVIRYDEDGEPFATTVRGVNVFDEIWLNNTNTERTLDVLWHKYGTIHEAGWFFYGDASGQSRKTSATVTDYLHIKNDERFKATVKYPRSNPAVRDRLAATNMMLKNASGESRLHIHPRCTHLISDLETRPLMPTGEPDDSDAMSGHITDALGYLIAYEFPITLKFNTAASAPITVVSG